MNKFVFDIDSKEKNIEELYKEIERLNKNDININQIKNAFIQIKKEYKHYDDGYFDDEDYLRSRIYKIIKQKNNKAIN